MSGEPLKILLVDDDEDDFIITRELISQIPDHRYQLEWLMDYDDALAAVRSAKHDLCLLDYRLGSHTGLELLSETQAFSGRPPVILLTGQGDQEIDIQAMKLGAADYLIKGQLSPGMLERAIRYAIEGRHARENLRRERDLLSRVMETSPVGIVVADQSGEITFANQRAEAVLGLTKEAVANKASNVLDWGAAGLDGQPVVGGPLPLQQLLETGRPVQNACHVLELPDHHRALVSTNATPLFSDAGKIDGMVVTVEDITERLALEAQLRHSQKMESVGQLAAGVAHDINNILTVIQGHTELLMASSEPQTDAVKSLEQIAAASQRAAGFVRHLLLFSRKQVVQTKILDLNAVLHNLEGLLPRMLGEHIELETAFQGDLPHVAADTGMIEQIMMNLVVNARDAMPRGGKIFVETSTVEITSAQTGQNPEARPGTFVCLAVRDTGCGIEPRLLSRIFEPFFTTKDIGKGTGLGLATVYGIVKQLQGWVDVASEVGTGSTFRIYLSAVGGRAVVPVEKASESAIADDGGGATILVAEDEIKLLELVRKVLQRSHYRVLTATSGIDALRVWDEHQGSIDLLLTDMVMPGGINGNELAIELQKRKPALRVIIASGYSAELVGKDFGQGNTVFLPKPYLPGQLIKIIREALATVPKAGN